MVISAINFFFVSLISNLALELIAAHHHHLADHTGQHLQPLHQRAAYYC
jgi:hypothetical protein